MNYNGLIDHRIDTDLETEPVSLDELKAHLNMLFETDNSYQFNDDDGLLGDLIVGARQMLEKYTGLSFAPKTITAIVSNYNGDYEIPFGPVNTVTSLKDRYDNAITTDNYKLIGLSNKMLAYPRSNYLQITYTAGYDVLPEPLKRAIKEECAFRYNHRGDEAGSNNYGFEVGAYCKSSLELAAPYKRTSWLR